MFNSENDFIKEPRRRSGKADRRYASREGPSRHSGSVGSSAELDRLVGDEDEHVPDLLRLVLLHREDDRIGPPRAKVFHQDMEVLVQDFTVFLGRVTFDDYWLR